MRLSDNLAEEKEKLDQFVEHAKEYLETRLDLISLSIQEKVSDLASSLAFGTVLGILAVCAFLFLSAGTAWWIGETFHSPSLGFFCVAGFFLLVGVLTFLFRNQLIITPVINFLMKKIKIHEEED